MFTSFYVSLNCYAILVKNNTNILLMASETLVSAKKSFCLSTIDSILSHLSIFQMYIYSANIQSIKKKYIISCIILNWVKRILLKWNNFLKCKMNLLKTVMVKVWYSFSWLFVMILISNQLLLVRVMFEPFIKNLLNLS